MADQKRRTQIQIETHEVTIIRFVTANETEAIEPLEAEPDVRAYAELLAAEGLVLPVDAMSGINNKQTDEENNEIHIEPRS